MREGFSEGYSNIFHGASALLILGLIRSGRNSKLVDVNEEMPGLAT